MIFINSEQMMWFGEWECIDANNTNSGTGNNYHWYKVSVNKLLLTGQNAQLYPTNKHIC
jgi:hypothetical protein